MLPPRRLFRESSECQLRVCFARDAPYLPPLPAIMSLRLALRAGRLVKQLPARQVAVGAVQATRRIHSSQSAKGQALSSRPHYEPLTKPSLVQPPPRRSRSRRRPIRRSRCTPRQRRSCITSERTSFNVCPSSSSSSPCSRTN